MEVRESCIAVQRMSVPMDQGDPKVFQFKTAPLEGEGQGSLECVHQERDITSNKGHLVW